MKPHFRATEFTKRPMEAKPVLLVTARGQVIEGSWRWGIPMGLHWADVQRVPIRPTVTHWATKPKAPR